MDKGWGLTLNSDPSALAFFSNNSNNNKPPSSAPVNFKRIFDIGTDSLRMFQFPVHREADPSSPPDDNRVVVGEVDFFSDKRNGAVDDHRDHDHHPDDDGDTKGSISVKKENNSLGEAAAAPRPSSDVNTGLHLLTANTGSDQSTVDDGVSSDVDEKRSKSELAQLQVELQRMKEENQRLRDMLNQVTSNYSALQMHLVALMQQQQQPQLQKKSTVAQNAREHEHPEVKPDQDKKDHQVVPRQFLDLGRPSAETNELSHSSSDERTRSGTPQNHMDAASVRNNAKSEMASYDQENSSGKRIAREESPESESQGWNPNKVQKLNPANNKAIDQSSEATMRKARVSVRARSEAPMISDGCQWRKYGQKMAKGNPCPRAYYRCTMAVGCPVRKQVQRCAEDRTILITTYEGNHNHPLPPAAMAMASTTTAAASMLLSGSMSSADGIMNPNLLARAILPCSSSMATISASAPFPTVTLDLTHNPSPIQFQRPPTHFQVPFPSQPQNFAAAASSSVPAGGGASQLPQILGQALYNQSKFSGLQLSQEPVSSQQQAQPTGAQQHSIADTVSAATAAITADPNFTAALAAAITSIIGGANNSSNTSTSNNSNANNTKQH